MSSVLYLLIIVAFGLSVWAQFKVKGTFNKWSESPAFSGMTGA
ncbi:MAG: zinc metallopeptidase, partial [Planifilum fulgidum]